MTDAASRPSLNTEGEGSGAWAAVLLSAMAALALNACSISPYQTSLAHVWIPSPNYNERRPNFVVIHHTSSTLARALATLRDPVRELSAHYLIERDGRTWHEDDA